MFLYCKNIIQARNILNIKRDRCTGNLDEIRCIGLQSATNGTFKVLQSSYLDALLFTKYSLKMIPKTIRARPIIVVGTIFSPSTMEIRKSDMNGER